MKLNFIADHEVPEVPTMSPFSPSEGALYLAAAHLLEDMMRTYDGHLMDIMDMARLAKSRIRSRN